MMRILLEALIKTLFPEVCTVCGSKLEEDEHFLCNDCMADLPVTYNWNTRNNPIFERTSKDVELSFATTLFHYTANDPYSNIILHAKFKNQRKLAYQMGQLFAHYLKKSPAVVDLDYIIALPLHKSRKRWRGYNQSDYIAKGIGEVLGVEVLKDVVVRDKKSRVQSKIKDSARRKENVKDLFSVRDPEQLKGKKVMLVDDVITSGSTISSCAKSMKKAAPTVEIVVAALSSTK